MAATEIVVVRGMAKRRIFSKPTTAATTTTTKGSFINRHQRVFMIVSPVGAPHDSRPVLRLQISIAEVTLGPCRGYTRHEATRQRSIYYSTERDLREHSIFGSSAPNKKPT